jgi:hypothetical protein
MGEEGVVTGLSADINGAALRSAVGPAISQFEDRRSIQRETYGFQAGLCAVK